MKRKLLLLNALLFGLGILAAADLYRQWIEGEQRVARLDVTAPDAMPPTFPPRDKPPNVRPADHRAVADRMLFSSDRNPIVEVAAPEVVVEERPTYPRMSGLVDFGDGPQALMSAGGDPAKWIGIGDEIGDFVFTGVDGEEIKLTWKDEEIVVTRAELAEVEEKPKPRPGRAAAAPAAAPPAEAQKNLTAAAKPAETVGGKHNIGSEFVPGRFRADPNDGAADGTKYQGYVKRVRRTPFGSQAWWEKQ